MTEPSSSRGRSGAASGSAPSPGAVPDRPGRVPLPPDQRHGDPPHSAIPPQWLPHAQPSGLPAQPSPYPHLWRVRGLAWWRPHLVVFLAVIAAIGLRLLWIEYFSGLITARAESLAAGFARTYSLINGIGLSVSIALLTPVTLLLGGLVGQRSGWLSSVAGRMRWGWLLRCAAAGAVVVAGFLLVIRLPGVSDLVTVGPGTTWLLVLHFLVLPLQAAGAEYFFRGVVTRGAASLMRSPVVGAVLGAVVSAVIYVVVISGDVFITGRTWQAVAVFASSLLLSWLAWRTGGLEAGVVTGSVFLIVFPIVQSITWETDGLGKVSNDPMVLLVLVPMVVLAAMIFLLTRIRNVQRLTFVTPAEAL